MPLTRAGVIGAGTMGMGIAQWLACSGFGVTLRSGRPEALEAFEESVRRFYTRRVKRGTVAPERRDEILGAIRTTGGYDGFEDADILFENVAEDLAVKAECFKALDSICPERTIFSSNTSSLSIAAMADATERPDRFLGIHFFQPARFTKLVEVVSAQCTSGSTRNASMEICRAGGKEPILVKDRPGFMVNRVLGVYLLEAVRLVGEKGVDPGRIDRAMTGRSMPVGPCRMADIIGLDLLLAINRVLMAHDPVKFCVSPVHEALVASGDLGQRSGRGIYIYGKSGEPDRANDTITGRPGREAKDVREESTQELTQELTEEELAERMLLALLNEAWLCVEEGIAAAGDVDHAVQEVLGMPKGPLALTEEMGHSVLAGRLEALARDCGERFRPAAVLGEF